MRNQKGQDGQGPTCSLGTPSKVDLKKIRSMNAISNLPVQASDVDLAEKIYGPDIGTLKGKTTRKSPLPMETDIIELPPEITEDRSSWELCMDVMFVNGMPFLTSITRKLFYSTIHQIQRGQTSVCCPG